MADRSLWVRLGLNSSGYTAGVNSAIAKTDQLKASVDGMSKRMQSVGKGMQNVGKKMSMYLSLPLAAAGAASVKFAADFETAMVEVQKVTDQTTADKLSSSIREMAKTIPLAQTELAALAADAARFGVRGVENIENFTETVAKMAEATDLASDEAGSALAKIAQQANVPIPEIENLGSSINELSNNFATSSSEIVQSMLRSSATMSNFGLNARQIAGVSAQMNAMSESAERAGTRLRRLFQTLMDPKKIEKVAGALGMTSQEFIRIRQNNPQQSIMMIVRAMSRGGEEANKLKVILGTTARTALTALAKNTGDVTRAMNMSAMAYSENTSLQKEFDAATKTFNARLTKFVNRLKDVGITIGRMIMPFVEKLLGKIENAVLWFQSLSSRMQRMIMIGSALVAALGPLLMILGGVATGIGAIASAMSVLMGPIGLVIGGLAAVAAGVVYLMDNWKALKERITNIGWWKNALIDMAKWLTKTLIKALDLLLAPIRKLGDLVGIETKKMSVALDPFIDKLDNLKADVGEFDHEFGSFGDAVKNAAKKGMDALGLLNGKVKSVGSSAEEAKKKAVDFVKAFKDLGKIDTRLSMGKIQTGGVETPGLQDMSGIIEQNEKLKKSLQSIGNEERKLAGVTQGLQQVFMHTFKNIEKPLQNFWKFFTNWVGNMIARVVSLIAAVAALTLILSLTGLGSILGLGTNFKSIFKTLSGGGLGDLVGGVVGLDSGGEVTKGGLFKVHKDEYISMPAGSAVTPAGSVPGGGDINVKLDWELRGENLRAVVREVERKMGNTT